MQWHTQKVLICLGRRVENLNPICWGHWRNMSSVRTCSHCGIMMLGSPVFANRKQFWYILGVSLWSVVFFYLLMLEFNLFDLHVINTSNPLPSPSPYQHTNTQDIHTQRTHTQHIQLKTYILKTYSRHTYSTHTYSTHTQHILNTHSTHTHSIHTYSTHTYSTHT